MTWLDEYPGARTVWTAVPDLNGQARGKRIPADRAVKLVDGTAKMPLSSLSLDIFGDDIAGSPLVFETGDQDGFLQPTDRGPLPMAWVAEDAVLLPMTLRLSDGQPFEGDPRHALRRVLDRYGKRGWHVIAATELEFYLMAEAGPSPLAERLSVGGDILGLRSLETYEPFFKDLDRAAEKTGLRFETATSESGSGQFEVTLAHGPALRAADDTWLFKMLARGIAHRHGLVATFMAKPDAADAGNGMHVHFSVLDADGRNIFDDGSSVGSETLRHAVGGCLAYLADATLVFAPHENSYHRLVPESHAPTAITWGYENRTVALRIPDGPDAARRIEHRVAGGDVNPYLMLAAVLGSAFVGIEDAITPPAPVTGNGYDTEAPTPAPTWEAAIDRFATSTVLPRVFHPDLISYFTRTKRQELRRLIAMDEAAKRSLYLDRV